MCVFVYSIHASPLHPSPPPPALLHDLPVGVFTLTAALALWGSVTTGQLQAEIRTRFIFLLNTFPFEGDQRIKAETGRTVRLNLMELIVTRPNRQLQRSEHSL